MLKVAAGLFCEKTSRTDSGLISASGILPGVIEIDDLEPKAVDAILQISTDRPRQTWFWTRLVIDGAKHPEQPIMANAGPPAHFEIELRHIAVPAKGNEIRVELREEGAASWIIAARLTVLRTKGSPKYRGSPPTPKATPGTAERRT